MSRPSRSTPAKSPTASFSSSCAKGGYDDQRFWSDADWAWIKEHGISHPHFWLERQGQWFYRAMFEEVPLPLDWPVYVSHAEASAYARFAGKSFPPKPSSIARLTARRKAWSAHIPGAMHLPAMRRGNFDFQRWDPVAVGVLSRRPQRFRSGGHSRQRLGVDRLPLCSPSQDLSLFPFTPATRRTSLMESIT